MKLKAIPDENITSWATEDEIQTKAYLQVEMKYRLYDGVHVQHPCGKYEYFEFPENATVVGVKFEEDKK